MAENVLDWIEILVSEQEALLVCDGKQGVCLGESWKSCIILQWLACSKFVSLSESTLSWCAGPLQLPSPRLPDQERQFMLDVQAVREVSLPHIHLCLASALSPLSI